LQLCDSCGLAVIRGINTRMSLLLLLTLRWRLWCKQQEGVTGWCIEGFSSRFNAHCLSVGMTDSQALLCQISVCRRALEQGATSQVAPALFPSSSAAVATSSSSDAEQSSSSGASATPSASCDLRGCAAAVALEAGSVVMSVPAKLLITYQTAAESDLGKALSRLPGGWAESIALIMQGNILGDFALQVAPGCWVCGQLVGAPPPAPGKCTSDAL
jgi:hypothetical protein